MAHITMKKALATPCKDCGVLPKLSDDYLYNGGLCLIYCPVCRAESLAGCRIHYATDTWYEMNKGAKNAEQQVQPDAQIKPILATQTPAEKAFYQNVRRLT